MAGIVEALIIHPTHLSLAGLAAFSGDRGVTRMFNIEEGASQWFEFMSQIRFADNPEVPVRELAGITDKRRHLRRYKELTANGRFDSCPLTESLRKMVEILGAEQAYYHQSNLGRQYATLLHSKEFSASAQPNLTINRDTLAFSSGRLTTTASSTIVLEYGPGATGFNRINNMHSGMAQLVLIDTNFFLSAGFAEHGEFKGILPPKLITRMDGMAKASDEIWENFIRLPYGREANGLADVVVMTMVHSAAAEEIEAGVFNAHKLLKPGGVLATQTSSKIYSGETEEDAIRQVCKNLFEKPSQEVSYWDRSPFLGRRQITQSFWRK